MENASKALLIAGAILLAILIIGVGIAVFSNTQGTIDSTMGAMDEQEINAFNSKFTSYQGNEISGSNVKALLNALAGNFGTYSDEPSKVPSVNTNNITGLTTKNATYTKVDNNSNYTNAISAIRNAIINKHTYKVTMSFGKSGIIDSIIIEDVTK